MDVSYDDFLTCVNAMMQLNKHETIVFRFLSDTDIFRGNFSDLAKQLKIDVSNLRKAVLHLEKLGIVYIGYKPQRARKTVYCIFIVDIWYKNLLKNLDGLKDTRIKPNVRKKEG